MKQKRWICSSLLGVLLMIPFGFLCAQGEAEMHSIKYGEFPVVPFNYSLKFRDTEQSISLPGSTWNDFVYTLSSPFRWDGKSWATFGGIVGASALIYGFDQPLYESLNFVRGPGGDYWTENLIEPLGDYRLQLVAMAGIYTGGWIFKSEKAKNVAILSTEALLLTGAMTQFTKFTTGRVRPHETNPLDPYLWYGIESHSSFWSGHAATSFAVASVFASIYRDKLWVPVTSYSLATLVALSRVYDGHHWTSDVFVGAAVGTAVGHMVVRNYRARAIKISPYYSSYSQGVTARITF